jgi:hypothetical protein
MRAMIARFSTALAWYQVAICSIERKRPRQWRVEGAISEMPMQGWGGARSTALGSAVTPHEPFGSSSRSARLVSIILAL